ncbi:Crp/Fnr family transcriptional regulator [Aureliella helgolandensis]|uniref:cAMP receptor protein n=1 Tax=Aureliella helgolandensis TaxID=2527968 RepID=A0A518G029_9BACT|nr:Crp/Fnr family transcriptional regulator [Aureliella helgolandensis]QDV21900.1 cAMP receptor protein [Aureliella helgolandensis]
MHDRIWYLQNCDLFEKLTEEQLNALERRSHFNRFPKGSPIYLPSQPADSVMLVADGLVKICHLTVEGKVSTLAFVKVGELFGELSLFDAEERGEYCEAVEPTTVIRIPRGILQTLMNNELDIALGVTKLVGLRRLRIENRLRNLLFNSNHQKLTHLLLDLADQFGITIEEGIRLGLKLSHQEMASLIGTTRETVTIVLGKMKADGLIGGQRQSVVLTDIERLAASVGRHRRSEGH